jgi:hypothetical protein
VRSSLAAALFAGLLVVVPAEPAIARGHSGSHSHSGRRSGQRGSRSNSRSSRSGGSSPPARYYYYGGSPNQGYGYNCGPSGCAQDGNRYGYAENRNSDYRQGYRDGYRDGQADNQPADDDGGSPQ